MKTIYKHLFSCLFVALFTQQLSAQNTSPFQLKGIVVDSLTRKPIEFATISILDKDRKVIALTYSDENGVFKSSDVRAGYFSLSMTFVGYRPKTLAFSLTAEKPVYEFGNVIMTADVTFLKGITVTATKQLVEQQPGMLIYNAEKDISNQGGTAADVLRKAPILNVDAAGNVTMRGNSNLRILINGKYLGQMARNAADALNMMPAGSIKSVEVITSPSARYDAEGAAGVINIITKKGNKNMSGTLEGVAGNLEQAINPRIALNREKWNMTTTLHMHRFRNKEMGSTNRVLKQDGEPAGTVIQDIVKDNAKPHGSGDFQLEYAPDSLNMFNFSANGNIGNWPDNSEQHNRRFLPDGYTIEDYRQSVTTKAPSRGLDLNLGYTRKLRKPGEELYLMAQFNRSLNDYNYNAIQKWGENYVTYRELNDNHTSGKEWTFQGDYIMPFSEGGKHALESGLKAILRDNSSIYDVWATSPDKPQFLARVPSRSDRFDYQQNVVAAYSQVKFKWKSGWALHAGARMEGTFLEGNQVNAGVKFKNDFWNFVPGATVFKKLNANNNLTLSYTRRISRPSIWDLNPNRDSQDPKNIVIGNPDLRPEEVDQVEFTYALQTDADFFINFSLFARNTKNSIESVVTVNNEGVATTTKQNFASNGQYGLNASTSYNVMKGWKINGNANVRYVKYSSGALNIRNDGMVWGLNLNSSWKLPNNYSVQAYGNYDAKSITLQGYETYWLYYSFSAKKELPGPKLTITLTTVSPFSKYIGRSDIFRSADFTSTFRNDYMLRSVRLSLNWEFGNMFQKNNARKIQNDDQKNVKSNG